MGADHALHLLVRSSHVLPLHQLQDQSSPAFLFTPPRPDTRPYLLQAYSWPSHCKKYLDSIEAEKRSIKTTRVRGD